MPCKMLEGVYQDEHKHLPEVKNIEFILDIKTYFCKVHLSFLKIKILSNERSVIQWFYSD